MQSSLGQPLASKNRYFIGVSEQLSELIGSKSSLAVLAKDRFDF
jgi:hypothetical protein